MKWHLYLQNCIRFLHIDAILDYPSLHLERSDIRSFHRDNEDSRKMKAVTASDIYFRLLGFSCPSCSNSIEHIQRSITYTVQCGQKKNISNVMTLDKSRKEWPKIPEHVFFWVDRTEPHARLSAMALPNAHPHLSPWRMLGLEW